MKKIYLVFVLSVLLVGIVWGVSITTGLDWGKFIDYGNGKQGDNVLLVNKTYLFENYANYTMYDGNVYDGSEGTFDLDRFVNKLLITIMLEDIQELKKENIELKIALCSLDKTNSTGIC